MPVVVQQQQQSKDTINQATWDAGPAITIRKVGASRLSLFSCRPTLFAIWTLLVLSAGMWWASFVVICNTTTFRSCFFNAFVVTLLISVFFFNRLIAMALDTLNWPSWNRRSTFAVSKSRSTRCVRWLTRSTVTNQDQEKDGCLSTSLKSCALVSNRKMLPPLLKRTFPINIS